MSDILLQKKTNVDYCIKQARDYYATPSDKPFVDDRYKQDATTINLQRACEQCVHMANHVICMKKLGLPSTSAESFMLLRESGIIDAALEKKMIWMVRIRNGIIHQYRDIDYELLEEVIKKHADNLLEFASILITASE